MDHNLMNLKEKKKFLSFVVLHSLPIPNYINVLFKLKSQIRMMFVLVKTVINDHPQKCPAT